MAYYELASVIGVKRMDGNQFRIILLLIEHKVVWLSWHTQSLSDTGSHINCDWDCNGVLVVLRIQLQAKVDRARCRGVCDSNPLASSYGAAITIRVPRLRILNPGDVIGGRGDCVFPEDSAALVGVGDCPRRKYQIRATTTRASWNHLVNGLHGRGDG